MSEDKRKVFSKDWWIRKITGEIQNYVDPKVRLTKKRVPLETVMTNIERAFEYNKITREDLKAIIKNIEKTSDSLDLIDIINECRKRGFLY